MASVPFNNLITFSRGSNATLTGPDGLIQWAPNNLAPFSEQFDNASWVKLGAGTAVAPVVTPNVAVAPDNTTTADLMVFNRGVGTSGSDISYISYNIPAVTATATASVWLKTSDGSTKVLQLRCGAPVATQITVTGAWQRFAVTSANATIDRFQLLLYGTDPNQTASVHIWGAQLELGSAATTYNSTTVKNLLGFSEAFDNAAWTKTRASIVTGAQANPVNGAFNAQKLMEDTAAGTHILSRSVTASASLYNYSIYAKAAERSVIRIRDSVNSVDGYFNLAAGVASNAVNATLSIVAIGNGWYRCSVTSTATVTNPEFGVRLASAVGTDNYTGDGNSGVYIYGAQLSDSASLDPYVPTPAAAPSSTAYYGPRFDYDPVTLAPKGLLVEEARTNLLLRSSEFDNASWTKSAGSITATTAAAPDGTNTADTFTTTGDGFVTQGVSASASTAYTGSVWLRVTTGTRSVSLFRNDNGTGFSTSSVTVTTTWQRFTLTATSSATATVVSFQIGGGGSLPNGSTIEIWGAQLEAGAFATSYISTVASTVTRSADVATINGSLFSQWYGQAAGTIFTEASILGASTNMILALTDGTTANLTQQFYNTATNIRYSVQSGGVLQAELTTAVSAGAVNKTASVYAANDFAVSVNGAAVSTDVIGSTPVGISQLSIGSRNGVLFLNGHIRSIDYIPARAADFQLQALTL